MTPVRDYDAARALRVVAHELDAHPNLPRPGFVAVHRPYAHGDPVCASFRFEEDEDAHARRSNVAAVEAWAAAWGAPITGQIGGSRGCHTEIDGVLIRVVRPAYDARDLDDGCHCPKHCAHQSG